MELNTALVKTRENIITFSYRSLVDALPEIGVSVLECLFAVGSVLTRPELGHLLDVTTDDIATGLTSLIRTSLVTRHSSTDSEGYSLSSSVRELLLKNPVNPDIREKVNDRLREEQQSLTAMAASVKPDPLSWDHIPDSSPRYVRTTAYEAFKAIRRHSSREVLLRCLDKVSQQLHRSDNDPVLLRTASQLYFELHDRFSAIDYLRRACATLDSDPASGLKLAEYYQHDGRLEEALALTTRLLAADWANKSRVSIDSVSRLLKTHWVVSIWLGNHKAAIDASSHWREDVSLRPLLACINVSAKKRRIEQMVGRELEATIVEVLGTLDFVLTNDGYIGSVAHETLNILGQIAWNVSRTPVSAECSKLIADFVDCHLPAVCAVHKTRSLDDPQVLEWLKIFQDLNCGAERNVLRDEKWIEALEQKDDPALGEYGYVTVEVYARPMVSGALRSFLFARDVDGREYYVSRRATVLGQAEFDVLGVGDRLAVLPALDYEEGKAIPVRDAIVLSQAKQSAEARSSTHFI